MVAAVVPVLANVEDDWTELCGKAQHAASVKDYGSAEVFYTKAIQKAELFGRSDVKVASTLEALGQVLHAEKKLADAEEALRRAVAIYSLNPGDSSMEFAQANLGLAAVLMDEGKYQPALQAAKVLLPVFDRNLEPNDNQLVAALCMEGDAYRQLKLYASAETPLKRCAEIQAEVGDVATRSFGETTHSLALVYEHMGRYTEADRYFTLAEKIRERAVGLLSPELAETLEAHAALLHQLGRDADAKTKERMASAIRSHLTRR